MKFSIAILCLVLAAGVVYVHVLGSDSWLSNERPKPGHATANRLPIDADAPSPMPIVETERNSEIVLGLRVRADRQCTVEQKEHVTPDGEMFTAYSCTPENEKEPHRYSHYDNDTLAVLAYGDAEAAAQLGRRLIGTNPDRSYGLLIRAAALDGGNVEHIAWLAEQAFGAITINDEPQVFNIERQYELAVLAARLGDDSAKSDYLRQALVVAGVDTAELDALDSRALELFESMREIQRTVLGETTIGGHGDA